MKKVLLVILITFIVFPVFQSCKKYENGPSLSLRSKKARVANDWAISSYIENDVDLTSDRIADEMVTTKDGGVTYYMNNKQYTQSGTWQFDDSKEKITIITTYTLTDLFNNQYQDSIVRDMKITKLKEKEMWLEGTISEILPVPHIWFGTSSNIKTYTAKIKFKSK